MPTGKENLKQIDQDIREHIERETLDNIERGMTPEKAHYEALRKFGNIQLIKEQTREVWVVTALEQIMQDIRFGLRMLRNNSAFACVTILTLALGIGVNTAVFSVINTVLLRPLPYPKANRVVVFTDRVETSSAIPYKSDIAGADFAEWRLRAQTFEKLTGYTYTDSTVAANNTASQTRVISIAGDFWDVTGAHTSLGRLFVPERSPHSVVLSDAFFKRQFKADPNLIGKVILLGGQPLTVSGVLPPDFHFLFPQNWWSGITPLEAGAFVAAPPLVRAPPSRLFVIARLKPSVNRTAALTELQGIESNILKRYPDRWFPGVSHMDLVPLQTYLAGSSRHALLILQVAGLFVLLIACVNIANLLLARGAARLHEVALRSAIGASAARILRQFLVEGIVLSLLGGAAGLLIAKWMILMLIHFGPNAIPRLSETSIDGQVLAFTFALCLGSGILFGFGPALALWKANVQNALKEGAKNSSLSGQGLRLRHLLVACELAFAVILVTGAGLMVKSFWKMYTNPPGFVPEETLVMKVALSGPQYADKAKKIAYFTELLHHFESMPGVRAFGIANVGDYLIQSKDSAIPPLVDHYRVSLLSPGYFHAIGMRLLKGRWLTATDPPDTTIINETMARRVFGTQNPIGKKLDQHRGGPSGGPVVGVVANLKYAKLDADPGPELFQLYAPNIGTGDTTITVAVRLKGDPLSLAPSLRKSIASIDPAQPVYDIRSLEQALAASVAARRFEFFLLDTFAAAALLMALVGVYGVIAYSVTERTREIGIRIALGAQRHTVVRMVVAQGLAIGLCGIAAGLIAAYGLTHLMTSLLYGVDPNDPATFAATALALTATVLLASWAPALKAALVDPLVALRYE